VAAWEGRAAGAAQGPRPAVTSMEIICPRCGFTNKHQAVRCECCLAELAGAPAPPVSEAAAPPETALAEKRPAAAAARAAPAVPAPSMPPGTPEALGPRRPSFGQPPPLSPEIAKGSGAVIAGLMAIGLLGGLWMLKPQPGQARIKLNLGDRGRSAVRTSRTAAPRAQAPAPPAAAPLTPPAAAPSSAPATAAAPAAAAVPRATREEEAAEAQFKTALGLLQRKQTAPARGALQELAQKYPNTKSAREARALLAQIPEERQAAQAAARPAVPPAREPAAATAARGSVAARTAAGKPAASGAGTAAASAGPAQAEQSRRVFTSDDLAGGRVSGSVRRAAPSIPASLQSSQAGQSSGQGVKAALQDELRLLRTSYESGQWTVEVEYNLVTTHARPVYLGAWMTDATVSRRLGYTAAPMSSGRGTARIVLPSIPPTASNLRIVFFEDKGALFFTRDFVISK